MKRKKQERKVASVGGMWKFPTKPWFLKECLILGGWDYTV
jgi:hypothetical protein